MSCCKECEKKEKQGVSAISPIRIISPPGRVVLPQTTTATLVQGQQLNANQRLVSSPNGRASIIMQSDGNLVVYDNVGRDNWIWASGTQGSGAVKAVMQSDGNFVLYTAQNRAVWATNTRGSRAIRATIQDDGNFVLYTAQKQSVWATLNNGSGISLSGTVGAINIKEIINTFNGVFQPGQTLLVGQSIYSQQGKYRVTMQGDGNFVYYGPNGVVWASGTESSRTYNFPAVKAVMQTDGNLVLYANNNGIIWASNTQGNPGARAIVQDDGNFVIYSKTNQVLWASASQGYNFFSGIGNVGDASTTTTTAPSNTGTYIAVGGAALALGALGAILYERNTVKSRALDVGTRAANQYLATHPRVVR